MLHYLTDPLQFTFMQRALVAVVFTGLACGVLGSYVVLRGLAFIGDALTHAVFPGIVIAFAAGQSVLLGALAVGVVTAAGIAVLSRGPAGVGGHGDRHPLRRDVRARRGAGVEPRRLPEGRRGAPLREHPRRVADRPRPGGAATAVAVGAIVLLQKELALVAFDREMAEAMRYPVFVLDLLLLGLITLAIVVSLRAIGNILVLAMLVTPAATARLLTDRLATMQVAAAAIGAASGIIGLYISFWWNVASGGAVVLTATAVFFAVFLAQSAVGVLRPSGG